MPAQRRLKINRFTVMALLQAARARRLGLSESSAFSWGLNRAIFYAAAKRGFPARTGLPGSEERRAARPEGAFYLGDELAYQAPDSPEPRFTIGGKTQTPEEFERQIASRFGSGANFRVAWDQAVAWVNRFSEATLRSGREFYGTVYKPRRDELVAEWSTRFSPPPEGDGPSGPSPP